MSGSTRQIRVWGIVAAMMIGLAGGGCGGPENPDREANISTDIPTADPDVKTK